MIILAIETSCDETAISIVEASGGITAPLFKELSRVVSSQIDIHKEWGGVVPNLAKREHQKLLVPVLLEAIQESGIAQTHTKAMPSDIEQILDREPLLFNSMKECEALQNVPAIDYLAVTTGPGLEPALWVGINFARALSSLWNIPVVAANHMEGHILSPLLRGENITFPAVALLISGGHTELILVKDWCTYELLGVTQDDAVGEAFDKSARVLGLPYPGGPEISKYATRGTTGALTLPRPMLHSNNLNFSFSGLKTAVKYYADDHAPLNEQQKADIALEFEQAVTDVLVHKTKKALEQTGASSLIVGGGVIANTRIRNTLSQCVGKNVALLLPDLVHCGDNASMIAAAAYIRIEKKETKCELVAHGSQALAVE
ncbi:MAG: tRNA (adenosine(37)-N6)-threonylcarbamoyltransferase complex transferase subunit TsaD [bacterium]|nr:tRNA (adenosine(37)-N6)-threonylcarbamoyltransferase complex transferase subunit TsaD [bacterium]